MANLNPQITSQSGLGLTFSGAAAAGDTFPNGCLFYIKNASAASINVTFNSQENCNHGFDHDLVVAVPAAGERLVGPFAPRFTDSVTGRIAVTYSAATSVTVAAIKI